MLSSASHPFINREPDGDFPPILQDSRFFNVGIGDPVLGRNEPRRSCVLSFESIHCGRLLVDVSPVTLSVLRGWLVYRRKSWRHLDTCFKRYRKLITAIILTQRYWKFKSWIEHALTQIIAPTFTWSWIPLP